MHLKAMMEYNTRKKRLPLPEYGRAVQKMVDYALTLDNKEERQHCAQTIIGIMGNMFSNLKEMPDFKRKLWDHLAIISDFRLDIDYPYDVIKRETFNMPPDKIQYQKGIIKNRHYGRCVESMIKLACDMPQNEEREKLIELITIQMKKDYLTWNKDTVNDKKIFEDLRTYSNGLINITESDIRINQPPVVTNPNNQRQNIKNKRIFKRKY